MRQSLFPRLLFGFAGLLVLGAILLLLVSLFSDTFSAESEQAVARAEAAAVAEWLNYISKQYHNETASVINGSRAQATAARQNRRSDEPTVDAHSSAHNLSMSNDPIRLDHSVSNMSGAIEENVSHTVRILCLVLTRASTHLTKAIHVKNTWGARCDKLLFVSDKSDSALDVLDSGLPEHKDYTWGKLKFALRHIYNNIGIENYDWFFKCDDDTYVIMENLRHMLASHSPAEPVWFGKHFKRNVFGGYMSGGPGYVLSREAMRRLIVDGIGTKAAKDGELPLKRRFGGEQVSYDYLTQRCHPYKTIGVEDVKIGLCLQDVNVTLGDSRDETGRARFVALGLHDFVVPPPYAHPHVPWYRHTSKYREKQGKDCCSNYPIAFHYTNAEQMYMFDYLLYHARVFDLSQKN